MASTTFVDRRTPIMADWLNDVNDYVYNNPAINVKNYGAVGDGTTDDTAAIQAAIAAAAVYPVSDVRFPSGNYRTTSTLTLPDTAGRNFTLKGFGNKIKKITLDGKDIKKPEIDANLTGKHSIEIELSNAEFQPSLIFVAQNKTAPETPQVFRVKNDIVWNSQKDVMNYEIWKNGVKLVAVPNKTSWAIPVEKNYCEYQVKAIDRNGSESFLSEPVAVPVVEVPVYVIDKARNSEMPPNGVLKSQKGHTLELEAKVAVKGKYSIEFLYLNAQGAINTDNKCAIRTLKLGGKDLGTVVFPQRGEKEWINAGYSNAIVVELDAANHVFSLVFEEHNANMNGAINTAVVQVGRLRKID